MRRAASPRLWPLCLLAFIRGAGSIDCFRDNFLRKDQDTILHKRCRRSDDERVHLEEEDAVELRQREQCERGERALVPVARPRRLRDGRPDDDVDAELDEDAFPLRFALA